ncbi:zinc finger protein 563 isoform X2 [Musca domestica]|uniref:Zinc finger protein 563 isoform X2 n=1 Tax=Musca domestica TaxID=7370 RepID=A0ABM3V5V8_MUSDO|nr:zinc finger protein 563 isoform X2 [Musca domestica]
MESCLALWHNWCRLCAKEDSHNIIIHRMDVQNALEKYFSLQLSSEDDFPNVLCSDCLSLVTRTTRFNKHVERVQHMYEFLVQNPKEYINLESIRSRFCIYEGTKNHWLSESNLSTDNDLTSQKIKEEDFEEEYKLELEDERNVIQNTEDECRYVPPVTNTNIEFTDQIAEEPFEECSPEEGGEKNIDDNKDQIDISYDNDPFDDAKQNAEDKYRYVPPLTKARICFIDQETKEKEYSQEEDEKNIDDDKGLIDISYDDSFDECQYASLRRTKIQRPLVPVIKNFPLNGECRMCGDRLYSFSSCVDHMRNKHGNDNENQIFECLLCDKALQSWYSFERHMRTHIPAEERKTHQCTLCESRFPSKSKLESHINFKHKEENIFICELCGVSAKTFSNLRQHQISMHTDLKPFECEICKKRFKSTHRLKIHLDLHSPNKHVCSLCGLKLNSRATLNRHFLVHSDDIKHKCDYCGRGFKRTKALKNHLILHTGLKPYACEFCDRTFANRSNCRGHMKKQHPGPLAALEATGNKSYTKDIPRLETLKAVTKEADNLIPVVTKFSGCFAFGKKPKCIKLSDMKIAKDQQKT